ncbi:MAG: hypothetical protein SV775_08355 [Thermodesulfobacteriota bacterium]|nr:hypothetical protein [Thermodesulfobacteriota bacterium]
MAKRIFDSPYMDMLIGAILFICGLSEALDEISKGLEEFRLKAHHGIMTFGLFSIFKALPDIVESSERIHKTTKEKK